MPALAGRAMVAGPTGRIASETASMDAPNNISPAPMPNNVPIAFRNDTTQLDLTTHEERDTTNACL